MASLSNDLSFGKKSELSCKDKLDKFFATNLIHRGGFSTFDYDNGSNIFVELKTRRIPHNMYPTAIIGANKVQAASKNPDNTYWFVYQYSDGLYGIKYDKEKFSKFQHCEYSRGERADYHNYPQDCYFIPSSDLSLLS